MPGLTKTLNNRTAKLIFWTLVLIPLGLATKFYSGPLEHWVSDKLSGILYVIFFSFLFSLIFKNQSPGYICLIVLLVTIILEFLQLVSSPLLIEIRSGFIGKTLIGNSFSWADIPYYIIGSFISYVNLFCWTYK